jgi:hypothetical protein
MRNSYGLNNRPTKAQKLKNWAGSLPPQLLKRRNWRLTREAQQAYPMKKKMQTS